MIAVYVTRISRSLWAARRINQFGQGKTEVAAIQDLMQQENGR